MSDSNFMRCLNQMDTGSTAVILAAPWLPTLGLNLTIIDHPLTRLALLVALVYAIRQGPFTGLLALLAVFSLLIERNHQLLTLLPDQKVVMPKKSFGLPVAAPRIAPDHETHYYEAHDEKGFDTQEGIVYESAQDLTDNNPNLQEVPQGEAAGSFYESKGLA
jgi:hypothetical protein